MSTDRRFLRVAAAAGLVVAALSLAGCGEKPSTGDVGADSTQDRECAPYDPWARAPEAAALEEWADSPEAAVRAAAGDETEILGVIDRTARIANVEVVLDDDVGVYETRRVRGRWVVVAGEGCATAVVPQRWDDLREYDCPPDVPPPDTDDAYTAVLCAQVADEETVLDD